MNELKHREQFCKDFKIPIKIFQSPYFEYYCSLYDPYYDVFNKLKIFNSKILRSGSIENYKSEWWKIKDHIEKDISSKKEFTSFINDKTVSSLELPIKVEKTNNYNMEFHGKKLISIDISSANFNSLKLYNPVLVNDTSSFKELLRYYSFDEYFSEFKIFRQLVFESLGAKAQQRIQKQITDVVIEAIHKKEKLTYIKRPSNDEIVIPLKENPNFSLEKISEILKDCKYNDILKVEEYQLEHVFEKTFVKKHANKFEFKNINHQTLPKVIKLFENRPLEEFDNYFIIDGKLAKFI